MELNEERLLLAINQMMDEKFANIDEKFGSMDEKFANIDDQFAKIDDQFAKQTAEIQDIKQDLIQVKLTLENETNRKINLMYESHQSIIKKQEKLAEVDGLKERVSNLEHAVMVHTSQIAELKQA